MELQSDSINFLKTTAEVACKLGIEKLILDVEENAIRGLHPDRSVTIISTIPENCVFDFKAMGLYRLNVFLARLNLMGKDNHKILVETDKDNNVQQLTFKKKRMNVEYRCASPSIIKAPKKISDCFVCDFNINEEAINEAQQVTAAMLDSSAKDQTISISNTEKGEICFLISDTVHDTTEFVVAPEFNIINDNFQPSFIFKYPVKLLMTFLRQPQANKETKTFTLGQRGILKSTIQGIDVYLLPRV